MRIAFAILKLCSGGSLPRDCVEIARICRQRGHDVVIFTASRGAREFADDLAVAILPIGENSHHRMLEEFSASFRWAASMQGFDLLVGFDKITHLDVLYCTEPSMYSRMKRERFRFLSPRHRAYLALERASFAPGRRTRALMSSHHQRNEYWNVWHTAPERLTLLPPTISGACRQPENRSNGVRAALRAEFGFVPRDWVWIAIGVQTHAKGLDRTIRALREFPSAKLVVVGLTDSSTPAAKAMVARAKRFGVTDRISFAGYREDVPELMAAADLLVHPARQDTVGSVILEAIVNGLPVVTTAACGYAQHVDAAEAGVVINEPFGYEAFFAALAAAADVGRRSRWSASAERYGAQSFLYDGHRCAAEAIIEVATERVRRRPAVAGKAKPATAEVIYLHESRRVRGAGRPAR